MSYYVTEKNALQPVMPSRELQASKLAKQFSLFELESSFFIHFLSQDVI